MRILGGVWVNGRSSCESASLKVPPSVLPDISPTRGEIGKWDTPRQSRNIKIVERSPRFDLPLVAEMSGRTEGGEPRTLTCTATPSSLTP
ncbi:hypothetical protein D3C72_1460430 [compost metagenome]